MTPTTPATPAAVREGVSIADVLERAASLIEPEGRWTQGTWARRNDGERIDISPIAACFCLRGAICLAGEYFLGREPAPVATLLGFDAMHKAADWNDAPQRTQAEVVAKLREAAALARARGL